MSFEKKWQFTSLKPDNKERNLRNSERNIVDITYPFSGKRRWPSVFSLSFVCVFVALGVWQLSRASFKADLQTKLESNRELPAVELSQSDLVELRERPKTWQFRQVTLTGHYDSRYIVYLDNRVQKGVVGYHILTPFELIDGSRIMVNRGWIGAGNREVLPVVETNDDQQQITVSMNTLAKRSFTLGEMGNNEPWPQRWTHVDQEGLAARMPFAVLPVSASLRGPDGGSQLVQGQMVLTDTWVARHRGYALQWFLMAVVLAGLYARLMWRMRDDSV